MRNLVTFALAAAVLLGAAVPVAHAQKGVGDPTGVASQPVKPEIVSLSGKIVEVQTGPCQATTGRSLSGTHIILETAQEEQLNIHLGPAQAIADTVANLPVGKQVAVKAFRTEKMKENHYVAQSLTIGETTIELRDEGLRPAWSGGSIGPQRAAGGRVAPGAVGRGAGAGIGPGWGRGQGGGRGQGWGRGQGAGRGQGWGPGQGAGRGQGWGPGQSAAPGQGWGRGSQQAPAPLQREREVSESPVLKLAITAAKPSMDAAVAPQFGQAAYFLLVDPAEETFEAVKNPNTSRGNAGGQATELIAAKGATVLLTGKVGPKAREALSAASIEVVSGCSGTVRTVLQQFKAGQLQPADTR